ncbi:MAG TPA: penicillin-binding protein 1A [Firmicutes bacterium]|nr:penicillin-binding protein 1A [Bacillota bacterium]
MARKQKKSRKKGLGFLKIFFLLILMAVLVGVGATAAYVLAAIKDMPSFDPAKLRESSATSFVYDARGELLTKLHGEENRVPVKLSDIPQELQDAVVAIEDARFYEHPGVDLRAIARAAWRIATRQSFEGGSTITQQLVKNVFLTPETTLRRKIQEAILSLQIERVYTKEEILEMYLNEIHLGHGTNGVQAAAKTYFGKDVRDLNLAESAMLAGIIKRPSRYSPYNDMEAAKARQALVLDQMVKYGYISEATAQEAKEYPIEVAGRSPSSHPAPYFIDYVISTLVEELEDYYGSETNVYDAIYRGGLKIYTTLDPVMQHKAEETLANGLPEGEVDAKGIVQPQAALVTMETKTGYIRAMVGGRDYENTKFNRAVQAQRQPGSAFKTFVYTAALDSGFTPASTYIDAPVAIPLPNGQVWQPKNSGNTYEGLVNLRRAIARSLNTVAAQLIMDVGVEKVVDYAERMGITTLVKTGSSNDMQPAIALGGLTYGVTPLDMAVAYGVLANQGVKVEPIAILRVEDRNGNIILENTPTQTQVLTPQTSYLMTDMLKGVITGGTGGRASIGRPAAGKTGTTSDYNDAWFVGYTPDLVTSIWVGCDDRVPGQKTYMERNRIGSALPAQLWGNYMKEAVKEMPVTDFVRPSGIVGLEICSRSGLLPGELCPQEGIRGELFIRGLEPKEVCSAHEELLICPESGALATEYCPNPEPHVYTRLPGGELEGAPEEYCTLHQFPVLVEVTICRDSGLLATDDCPRTRRIFLLKGQVPEEYCYLHGKPPVIPQPPSAPGNEGRKEDEGEEGEEDWDWDGWLPPPSNDRNNGQQNRYQAEPWNPN